MRSRLALEFYEFINFFSFSFIKSLFTFFQLLPKLMKNYLLPFSEVDTEKRLSDFIDCKYNSMQTSKKSFKYIVNWTKKGITYRSAFYKISLSALPHLLISSLLIINPFCCFGAIFNNVQFLFLTWCSVFVLMSLGWTLSCQG